MCAQQKGATDERERDIFHERYWRPSQGFSFYTIKSVRYNLIDLCAKLSLEQLRDFVRALHRYYTRKKSNAEEEGWL